MNTHENDAGAPWARLLVNATSHDKETEDILRSIASAHLSVVTIPVGNLVEPELSIGLDTYRGVSKIKKAIEPYAN